MSSPALDEKEQETQRLPPPNWSPTGNTGAWHWGEYGVSTVGHGKRECWTWKDDEPLYKQQGINIKKNTSWLDKLKNLIKTKTKDE
jgi:hypothetical protein